MTLLDLIEHAEADRTALVLPEQGSSLTYADFRGQVEAVARQLAAAGVGRGDRVAIALGNGLGATVTILAASVAGTAAPLNPGYRGDEFRFYLEDTNARVLIVPSEGAEEAREAAKERGPPILTAGVDQAGRVRLGGVSGARDPEPSSDDDVALVLHTSGSTGRPKRVPLTHRNLTVSAIHVADSYELSGEDVTMGVMPLFHIHGIVASMLATFHSSGAVVIPERFNPLSFWRIAGENRVTWYTAVPTIHQLLLARAESAGTKPEGSESLRFIRSCSAALSPDILKRLESAFDAPVLEAYGMTEAAHQMSSNPLPPGRRKAGTVGKGTGVEIRVGDGKGKTVETGATGEVLIRGENVIDAYENNPEANAASFFGEWFRTGDQGRMDRDGYLTLVGRIKELINRGGEKISPREIDEVLIQHPAVEEAVGFGVPHKSWGEEVEAAVVLKGDATAEDLIAYCRERLADFKVPKRIHIADAIPKTATGKIQRRKVAEHFSEKKG